MRRSEKKLSVRQGEKSNARLLTISWDLKDSETGVNRKQISTYTYNSVHFHNCNRPRELKS